MPVAACTIGSPENARARQYVIDQLRLIAPAVERAL